MLAARNAEEIPIDRHHFGGHSPSQSGGRPHCAAGPLRTLSRCKRRVKAAVRYPVVSDDHPSPTDAEPTLAQVRDLLFGHQSRQIDHRIVQLEGRVEADLAQLRSDLTGRLAELRDEMQQQLGMTAERLERGLAQQEQSLSDLARDFADRVDGHVRAISDRIERTEHDLRQHTAKQTQNLWDDLRARQDQLSQHMNEEFTRVRLQSASRGQLSAMFRELATRLSDEA